MSVRYTVRMLEILGFSVPIVYVHLVTLGCTVLCILFADHQAFSWVLGHTEKLNKKTIEAVHYLTLAGLGIMILSGVAMALPMKDICSLCQHSG